MKVSEKILQLKVEHADNTPLYIQLINSIKLALAKKNWLAGEAIPTERALAKHLNISRGTARKAIQILIAEGLLTQVQGSGTFVAPILKQSLTHLESFNDTTKQSQYHANHYLLFIEKRYPSSEEASVLQLEFSQTVNEIVRIQTINHLPVSLQRAVLSISDLIPMVEVANSLYQYLDSIGQSVAYAKQKFQGAVADEYLARNLNIAIGTPLLLVIRTGFSAKNVPIEYTYSWHINEYCDFTLEIKKQ